MANWDWNNEKRLTLSCDAFAKPMQEEYNKHRALRVLLSSSQLDTGTWRIVLLRARHRDHTNKPSLKVGTRVAENRTSSRPCLSLHPLGKRNTNAFTSMQAVVRLIKSNKDNTQALLGSSQNAGARLNTLVGTVHNTWYLNKLHPKSEVARYRSLHHVPTPFLLIHVLAVPNSLCFVC